MINKRDLDEEEKQQIIYLYRVSLKDETKKEHSATFIDLKACSAWQKDQYYGEQWKKWNAVHGRIILHGNKTRTFEMGRGIKQKDNFSSSLFIEEEKNIKNLDNYRLQIRRRIARRQTTIGHRQL